MTLRNVFGPPSLSGGADQGAEVEDPAKGRVDTARMGMEHTVPA